MNTKIDPDQIAKTINLSPLPSKLAAVLGLPPGASPSDIRMKLEDYEAALDKITALTAPNDGIASGSPPAPGLPPPDDTGMSRRLTPEQNKLCRERGINPQDFARTRAFVRGGAR